MKNTTKEKSGFRKIIASFSIILIISIACASCSFKLNTDLPNDIQTDSTSNLESFDHATTIGATVTIQSSDVTEVTTDLTRMIKEVMPAMVSITVKATTVINGMFGRQEEYETEGSGSGIIISQSKTDLYIVTNHHVIDGAKEIIITFANETTLQATVKGSDSDYDLAVLTVPLNKIDEETANAIKCITIGSSDILNLGEPAIAIGNALGYGQSVTVGYISALAREIKMENNTMTLLQTDAAINPGNSGGALLNIRGELIGINSAKFSSTDVEGMGFAIPISDAIPVINDIINEVAIPEDEQGYLGITGSTVNSTWISYYNWPEGVYITAVSKGSPADKAGLKSHDIITKIDGRSISTIDSLTAKLKKKRAGEEVEITVMRQDDYGKFDEITIKATLGSKSEE